MTDRIARRLRLPDGLRPLTGIWRRIAHGLWWVMLALATSATIGGGWLGWQQARDVSPAFYQLGLSYTPEWGSVSVAAMTPEARRAGPVWPGYIVSINGKPAPEALAPLAAALRGPPGAVRLGIDDEVSPVRTITLQRGPAIQRAAVGSNSPIMFFLLKTGTLLIIGLVMIGCSILIMRRRGDDPVAQLLAFGFLGGVIALTGGPLWLEFGLEWLDDIDGLLFLGPLAIVITAFPDGRFRSPFAAGVALATFPVLLLVSLFPSDSGLLEGLILLLLLGLTVLPYQRFRRTPPGIERQQLKWAAFGFVGSAGCLIVAAIVTIAVSAGAFPASWEFAASLVGYGVTLMSLVVLAVATTIAILRINLWDADAAIGESAAVGAVTAILGGVWAASTIVANEVTTAMLGGDNKALAAGASAVIAGTVLGPARARVNKWVDKRFSGDVNGIKALPEQLRLWQGRDRPREVARRVLDAVIKHLGASRAALLVWDGDGFSPIGLQGIDDNGELADWIAVQIGPGRSLAGNAPDDPRFPIRLTLDDGQLPIGVLLVGGRPQGAGLSSEMRSALQALRTPLAAALRQACRIDAHETAVLDRLAALDARLDRLEAQPAR